MAGIATVTLNAALDRTLRVDRLEIGRKTRLCSESVQSGGKGVNVARVLHALGVETRALVVVGGTTGRAIADDLGHAGLPSTCIEAPGESRTCIEIVEPDGRATQLHGSGVEGGGELILAVVRAIEALPDHFTWIALCGSQPPGMPSDGVRSLLLAARRRGLRVAIDTSGAPLAQAWAAGPDLVRINDVELASIGAIAPSDAPPYRLRGDAPLGVVSRGANPFEAWEHGACLRITPPRVDAVSAIGCGDAMMAGLLESLAVNEPFADALRRATALAVAAACSPVAGSADLALARSLEPRIAIEPAAR